jgi:predicted XRE-type DNA-binding protein
MKRESVQIKAWMVLNGISQADIGRELGIPRQNVCAFIKGNRESRKVLNYLIEKGCPREYLAIPDNRHEPEGVAA